MSETAHETTDATEAPAGDYQALAAALAAQKRGTDTEVSDNASLTDEPAEPDDDDDGNPNREAAKWRTKLRDTEAQRDALATQLANMQRAAVDTQVTALGIKPAALWASGANLNDLLTDEGIPDMKKVEAAATAARDTLGLITVKPTPKRMQSGAGTPPPARDKWQEAFAPQENK
jgi:hypothetical protein